MKTACVILAAGLGKRMNSAVPKVLHNVAGIPMIQSVVNTALRLRPDKVIVVAGQHIDLIRKSLAAKGVVFALQKEAKGTGHALLCARPALGNLKGLVVVMNGDTPLLDPDTIKRFINLHKKNKNDISVISFIAKNPGSYGRVVRDKSGKGLSIIEDKDADQVQKKIHEVNSGVYVINSDAMSILKDIRENSLKGEYYLTDIVALAYQKGLKTSAYCIGSEEEFMGVNTREELYKASYLMKKNIIDKWTGKGVNFLDAGSVFIHPDAHIGRGTTVYPNVYIEGHTEIGRDSTIYPNVRILNSRIGNKVTIKDSTVIEDSDIKDRASVGPFAHIRPGSEIGSEARIGNFVELKKAIVGSGTKASHLSYLGDTKIGRGANIGAGTITCNYDGKKKHVTIIEDGVFVGSDSQLVAPVRVGKGAYIGAGSTVTKDIPPGALAISRVEQRNILKWARRKSAVSSQKSEARKGKGKKKV